MKLFGFLKRQPRSRLEEASDPAVILRLSQALKRAYWEGYRPVPGYTVCERREDGSLYVAIAMEKDVPPCKHDGARIAPDIADPDQRITCCRCGERLK